MTLKEFKIIYWWEWGHRQLGRLIGLAFFVPFVFFLLTGQLEKRLVPHLVAMFVLGGLQGAMGWYMVMSGLVDRVDVSQYRLTVHLGLALVILAYMFWTALGLLRGNFSSSAWRLRSGRDSDALLMASRGAALLAGAIFLQILLGGFVAGLDAGLTFNTWPLMDGAFVPNHLYPATHGLMSAFEDVRTVQFNHRMFAYVVCAIALWHGIGLLRRGVDRRTGISFALLAGVLLMQMLLGIVALATVVPFGLALAHQGGAVLLFLVSLYHLHQLTYAAPA